MKSLNFPEGQENLDPLDPMGRELAEGAKSTGSSSPPPLLSLGSHDYLIELLPMAAYAVLIENRRDILGKRRCTA